MANIMADIMAIINIMAGTAIMVGIIITGVTQAIIEDIAAIAHHIITIVIAHHTIIIVIPAITPILPVDQVSILTLVSN